MLRLRPMQSSFLNPSHHRLNYMRTPHVLFLNCLSIPRNLSSKGITWFPSQITNQLPSSSPHYLHFQWMSTDYTNWTKIFQRSFLKRRNLKTNPNRSGSMRIGPSTFGKTHPSSSSSWKTLSMQSQVWTTILVLTNRRSHCFKLRIKQSKLTTELKNGRNSS